MNIREILNKLDNINKPISETSWQEIYDLNKDQIKNPNLIYPNQKLKMPGGGEYVVKAGDSLSKIAKTFVPAEPAKAEPAKAEPAKAEPAKAEPAKAEPAKVTQSGQQQPVQAPVKKADPTSDYDPDISHDLTRQTGFDWGKRRSKADIDPSSGDIGFKPDGGAYIRTPFQKSTTAIPQTGGTFNSSGYDANIGVDILDKLRKEFGQKIPDEKTQSGQSSTPGTTTPAATPVKPATTPTTPSGSTNKPTGPTGPSGQSIPGTVGPGKRDNVAQSNAYMDKQDAAAKQQWIDNRARKEAARQKSDNANAVVDKELAAMKESNSLARWLNIVRK